MSFIVITHIKQMTASRSVVWSSSRRCTTYENPLQTIAINHVYNRTCQQEHINISHFKAQAISQGNSMGRCKGDTQ